MQQNETNKLILSRINGRLIAARFCANKCSDLHVCDEESLVGNIYVGRVENVVKNLQCAFVEIQKGIKCYYSLTENHKHIFLNPKNNDAVHIGDLLLVQVQTEPAKTKPATATGKISLTGEYVVVSTDVTGISISGKTKKNPHCIELKEILQEQCSDDYGMILRTNSAAATKEEVCAEVEILTKQMQTILAQARTRKAFSCMYQAPGEYVRIAEGIYLSENQEAEIVTDDAAIYEELCNRIFSEQIHIRYYEDSLLPLYKLYSLETELERALSKKVWLKSGGYLVIEQTEALSVIDVNSGKQVGKKGNEEARRKSIYKTNEEAAYELARQIRLRNLSGMILVDFINMPEKEMEAELLVTLRRIVKEDSVLTTVVDITKLGLVEMTRKKSGKTLAEAWNIVARSSKE